LGLPTHIKNTIILSKAHTNLFIIVEFLHAVNKHKKIQDYPAVVLMYV
jgi:hypothetical protein